MKPRSPRRRALASFGLTVLGLAGIGLAAHGCSSDVEVASSWTATQGSGGQGQTSSAGGVPGSSGFGGNSGFGPESSSAVSVSSNDASSIASSASSAGGCSITPCQNHVYECGDGIDNDGDGLVDADDPDCTGPCDNTEASYFPGIPGRIGPACVLDCAFDPDSGSGNDDCFWNHKCDPNEVPPSYFPEPNNGDKCAYDPNISLPGTLATCANLHDAQSAACHDYCDPLVPNGCDCFGCCELPAGSGKYVWLSSMDGNGNGTCALPVVDDPSMCHPCEPVPGCLNPCDTCELCLGKAAIPLGCAPDDRCAPGIQPCGLPGEGCCPAGTYCITGCCQPTPQ